MSDAVLAVGSINSKVLDFSLTLPLNMANGKVRSVLTESNIHGNKVFGR